MSNFTYECKNLVLLSFITPAEVLQKHLPPHTKLDLYNGHCLISLAGYQLNNVKIEGLKAPLKANFDQIALQFYVKHFDGAKWKKGIVYLKQITDNALSNTLSNIFAHTKFTTKPTATEFKQENNEIQIKYAWKEADDWDFFGVTAENFATLTEQHSLEEFVLERPFVYQKFREDQTDEYELSHQRWRSFSCKNHEMEVDFTLRFGAEFSHLKKVHSAILAEGSKVKLKNHQVIG